MKISQSEKGSGVEQNMRKQMALPSIVSCEWLADNLGNEKLIVFDASYFLPRQQRGAASEFQQRHLPGAQFFDIDVIADLHNPLPHSLPDVAVFVDAVTKFGVDSAMQVIVYDNNDYLAAARVWWMFRVFGHPSVAVLDGGLPRWLQFQLPVTDKITNRPAGKFQAKIQAHLVYKLASMRSLVANGKHLILDTRSADSFCGLRPIEDGKLHPGHIPGSINIPYRQLFDANTHLLKSADELSDLLLGLEIDCHRPMVTSCGSGVSAAILVLALTRLGIDDIAVYDGSWAEWGRVADTPKSL